MLQTNYIFFIIHNSHFTDYESYIYKILNIENLRRQDCL